MGSTYSCPLTCLTSLTLEWGNLFCEVRLIGSQSCWQSYFSFFSSYMTKIPWNGVYFSSQFLVTVHHCGSIVAKGAQDGCPITSEKLSRRNACSFSARFPQSQTPGFLVQGMVSPRVGGSSHSNECNQDNCPQIWPGVNLIQTIPFWGAIPLLRWLYNVSSWELELTIKELKENICSVTPQWEYTQYNFILTIDMDYCILYVVS